MPVLEDERVALRNRAWHRYFARRVPVGEVKYLMQDVLASTTVRKALRSRRCKAPIRRPIVAFVYYEVLLGRTDISAGTQNFYSLRGGMDK